MLGDATTLGTVSDIVEIALKSPARLGRKGNFALSQDTMGARGPQRQTSSASMNSQFTRHCNQKVTIAKVRCGQIEGISHLTE